MIRETVFDIFSKIAWEKGRLLRDETDLPSEFIRVNLFDIFAIDKDLSLIEVVEAENKTDYRGFSRTRRTNYCHRLPVIDS